MEPVRILLVDDEAEIRQAVRRAIAGPGCSIHEASCAADGLEILRWNLVDAVISDYSMGDMDGVAFCERIRDLHPGVLRILLTGNGDLRLALNALNDGVVHRYLTKPWNDVDLRQIIRLSLRALRDIEAPPATPRRRAL